MGRVISYKLMGRDFELLYNMRAMLDVYDRYGDENALLEHLGGEGAEALTAAVWLFLRMAAEGNARRKLLGLPIPPLPDLATVSVLMTPAD